ncbi:MAG: histidinol-phosphate transaminase [Clostridia bacterium]
MSKFLSERFASLVPYAPGEQPQYQKFIKLNTNESPFPPSKKVLDAINSQEVANLKLYSDPTAKMLVDSIAEFCKVNSSNVFVGNGSDEVLAFINMAFCDSNKGMACPEIGYGFYPVFCEIFGLAFNPIKLNSDFSIDIKKYENIKENITIANPNAHTGLFLTLDKIEILLNQDLERLVIIDEAYCDFGGESATRLLDKYTNLIIVNTLSKSRQLAGARIGYALASSQIIDDLNSMKYSFNPYNLNRLSIIAGTKAMEDIEYFESTRKEVIANREWTIDKLKSLGFELTNSIANFLLVKKEGISGEKLYLALKEKGVLVRYINENLLIDYVRITIGSLSQMQILLEKLEEIIKENNL